MADSLPLPMVQRPRPDVHYSELLNEKSQLFNLFKTPDLLRDDGGLNRLGEIYTGAKTIHTEVITSNPTSAAYQTFNGADSPTQVPATTWAALAGSASQKGGIGSDWLLTSAMVSLGCFFGAFWTASWAS